MTCNPEPSTGGNDNYLSPRSKTSAKQGIYNALFRLDWRFCTTHSHWHTPEADTLQGHGRLEYDLEGGWARIQPPNDPNSVQRKPPLLELVRVGLMWTEK